MGKFWSPDDAKLMVGFDVSVEVKQYKWTFTDRKEMVDFVRNLFGLEGATDSDIQVGLDSYLKASETDFEWALMYFVATKPHTLPRSS